MSILTDSARSVAYRNGEIVISMQSGVGVRFAVAENPRLACGTPKQLRNIEISPFGVHWPDLDEDLSFRGLLAGDYGQKQNAEPLGAGDAGKRARRVRSRSARRA